MERYNSENIGIVKNIKETSQIAEERNINIIQESQDLNEIVGEYVSIPEFMVTVSKVAHSKNNRNRFCSSCTNLQVIW